MKTSLRFSALLLGLSTISLQLSTAFAQGVLAPTAAPAATMKSLDQIYARTDARIPITNSASTATISAPGSYYLTTNLTVSSGDGIVIATNNVALDLNGYTIRSTAASAAGYGIKLTNALHNITIANGFIESGVTNNGSGLYSGPGFSYGISYFNQYPANVCVSKISVMGCALSGIVLNLGDALIVDSCTVRSVGSQGIYASTVEHSIAIDCGGNAIVGDDVSNCRGESTLNGYGVTATTAQNCFGTANNSGYGISAGTAINCHGESTGIRPGLNAGIALNCSGNSSGAGNAINTTIAQNCFGSAQGSGVGVYTIIAQNCYGSSSSGNYGVYVQESAIGCYGYHLAGTALYARTAAFCTGYRPNGTAIQATVATGCYAISGTNIIANKYNMP